MDNGNVNFGLLARGVGSVDIQELRRNPAFALLRNLVKNRLNDITSEMFNGKPADPIRQGQGVAYRQLTQIFDMSADEMLAKLKQEGSK